MCIVLFRDHDKSCAVGQLLMICAHGVFHRVLACTGSDYHRVTRHCVRKCNMLPSFHITAVFYRTGQIFPDILDCRQLDHIAHQACHAGHISFCGVEQSVKPLICRKLRRNCRHQLRIYHCDHREKTVHTAAADLLICLRIRHYAPLVNLRTCSGCRGDRNDRKSRVYKGLHLTCCSCHIIPQISRLERIHCHDLRRVHDRAAAQCHNKVTAVVTGESSALLHYGFQRIRSDLIKQYRLHSCLLQLVHGAVQSSVLSCRFTI